MGFGSSGGGSFGHSRSYTPKRFDWPMPSKTGRHLRGLNDREDPTRLHPNEFGAVKNVLFRQGAIQRRGGTLKWLANALPTAISGLFYAQDMVGVDRFLAFSNKTAYQIPTTAGGVATNTTAGFTTADITGAFQYLGKVYAVNGTVDGLRQWDFTTWSAVAPSADADNDFVNGKKCKYITGSHDRIYLAGNPGAPQTVYISDLVKGPVYFPSGNEVAIDTADGQPITGLVNFDDWIIVFKSRSIHSIPPVGTGAATFQRYLNHPNLGCPNGATAQVYRFGVMIFLGSDSNIYTLRRDQYNKEFIYPHDISGKIRATLRAFTPAQLSGAWATIWNDYYLLHIGTSVLVLDLAQSNLSREDECVWTVWNYENQDMPVLFTNPVTGDLWGGGANGHLYKLDQGHQDDGTAIDWYAQTGWLDFGLQEYYKVYDRLFSSAKAVPTNQSYTISVDLDMRNGVLTQDISVLAPGGLTVGTSLLGTGTLGITGDASNRTVPTPLQGKRIRYKWKRKDDSDIILIWGLTTYWIPISPL